METWEEKEHRMIRKLLLIATAVAMPVGFIAATAGTASAGKVVDATLAPATASCTSSGGTLTFKVPIGIVTPGGYVAPAKNKGNQIKIAGVTLTCTSSAVAGTFTGTASGKIKTTHVGEDPATFYSCIALVGVDPAPGATLSGSLKIKWSPPVGQKFASSKSVVGISSVLGGVNGGGNGTFTIPGNPGTGSISDSFPGSDAGASSSATTATALTEAQLATLCSAAGGVSTIALGSGTSTLQ
jgi:hypothetical protein